MVKYPKVYTWFIVHGASFPSLPIGQKPGEASRAVEDTSAAQGVAPTTPIPGQAGEEGGAEISPVGDEEMEELRGMLPDWPDYALESTHFLQKMVEKVDAFVKDPGYIPEVV